MRISYFKKNIITGAQNYRIPHYNNNIWLFEHLTMEAHVNSVCRSSFFHLHNISSIRRVLDIKTTVIIVQALVISRLDYSNSLLCGLPAILTKRLQRVQNTAARVIAKAGRRVHIYPILAKLHWLPLEFRIRYKILLLTYRALHGLAPTYITELLVPYTPPRTLRSSTDQLLVVQKYRLKNSSESQIRLQKTLTSFRKSLKTVLTSVWWPHVVIDFFLSLSNVQRSEQLPAGYMRYTRFHSFIHNKRRRF